MAFMRNDRVKLIGKATKPSDSALQKTPINRTPPPPIAFGRAPESKRKKHTRFHHQPPKTSRFYDLFAEGAQLLPKKEFLTYLAIVFLVANIGPARLGAREADAQRSTHGNVEAAQSGARVYGQKTFDVELANGVFAIRNFRFNNGDEMPFNLEGIGKNDTPETNFWLTSQRQTDVIGMVYQTKPNSKSVHLFFNDGFVSIELLVNVNPLFVCNRNSFEQTFAEKGIDLNTQQIREINAMHQSEGRVIGNNSYYVFCRNASTFAIYLPNVTTYRVGRYSDMFEGVPQFTNVTIALVNDSSVDVKPSNLIVENTKAKLRVDLSTGRVTVLENEEKVSVGALN